MRNDPIVELTNYGGLVATLAAYGLKITDLLHYNMLYLVGSKNRTGYNCEQLIYNFVGKGKK